MPDHVLALIIALAAVWFLFRWGTALFLVSALCYFWVGDFAHAALAFCAACIIEAVKAPVLLRMWLADDHRRRIRNW